ncbi:alanine racemase [Phenylobacterium montanum]|uniref:Alanine racemase n=1 Tax=Phenylobacterium montanum TaxID=2823693 RepID=A0A975G3E9_9CAUL|nr:alanine racemase [Caulobacter sp. S6]QUD89961.1 alanine racemase [Caulobacter sp. S6]
MADDFFTLARPPMTPALVVRREALLANLKAMQGFCDAAGVALRAHGKMHKCSTLGRLQVDLGAKGLCCQTVGEAETYAAAGIKDLLVTAPIPPWGPARLATLAKGGTDIACVADDAGQIERLSAAAVAAGITIRVVIDLDLGLHRAGAAPDQAVALARAASAAPGLSFAGIQAYLGHLQHLPDIAQRRAADEAALVRLKAVVTELTEAGLAPGIVTGGGTGTYVTDLASGVFNEIQAGSYAFMDVEYGDCGAPDGGEWPFRPALFVAASVVSARHKTHVSIDAGLKAFSVDGPAARVLAGAAPGSRWRSMGDEHGAIFHPSAPEAMKAAGGPDPIGALDADPAFPWPADAPRSGDVVWLQPGHCDPTVNLYDALYVADEDGRIELWPVDARRRNAL